MKRHEPVKHADNRNNPYVIGYWARINNLTLNDVDNFEPLEAAISVAGAQEKFEEGWKDADDDIREESLHELLSMLESLD